MRNVGREDSGLVAIEILTTEPGGGARLLYKFEDLSEDQRDLLAWWIKVACDDFAGGAPKVDEYGAHDLEVMGFALGLLAWKKPKVALPVAVELSIWFYVLGKVARLLSDYMAQRSGKADTWHDITFYSMMARRVQETGRWP